MVICYPLMPEEAGVNLNPVLSAKVAEIGEVAKVAKVASKGSKDR